MGSKKNKRGVKKAILPAYLELKPHGFNNVSEVGAGFLSKITKRGSSRISV